MTPQNKGIYPNWVNDKDIINQILNEIIREGGRLPYSYVVNAEHDLQTRERMEKIVRKMQDEQLLVRLLQENDMLEIDVHGSRAVQLGYKKYIRIKKWDGFRHAIGRISYLLIIFIAIILIAGLAYFLWKLFK